MGARISYHKQSVLHVRASGEQRGICRVELNIEVSRRRFSVVQYGMVSLTLVFAAASYFFVSITGHGLFGVANLLEVGAEQSIPTYVSVVNLLLGSALVFLIYLYEKSTGNPAKKHWLLLSLLFLYLSVDEACRIHERFATWHDLLVEKTVMAPVLETHQWLPFGVFFLVVCSIVFLPFLRQLPRVTRRRFLFAGGIFVGGAIGIEYLGAVMLEAGMVDSRQDPAYLARRLLEEGMEMYGVVIFNCAVYSEIQSRNMSVLLRT